VPEPELALLRPRTLTRVGALWLPRLGPRAHLSRARTQSCHGIAQPGRIASWRPRLGAAACRLSRLPFVARILARRGEASASSAVRTERRTIELRLLTVRSRELLRPKPSMAGTGPSGVPAGRIRSAVASATRGRREPARSLPQPRLRMTVEASLRGRPRQARVDPDRVAARQGSVRTETTHEARADRPVVRPPAAKHPVPRFAAALPPRKHPRSALVVAVPSPARMGIPLPTQPTDLAVTEQGGLAPIPPMPPTPASVPAPNLDELVDRVLRRIERRAFAQRERLGCA